MKRIAVFSVLAMLLAVPSFGDDQQKAQKEINRITAMATDFDGRRVVNLSISEMFKVPRPELVTLRGQTGLNYGDVFIAEELLQHGATSADMVTKLKSGSTIADIARERQLDWKQVGVEAKKLNAAIDNNLYDFFLGKKETLAQDTADKYDVHYDGVKADASVSKSEIDDAQGRYLHWKDRAAVAHRDRKGMSYGDERIADMDHVSGGGPQGGGRGMAGEAGTQGPSTMSGPH
ncbi:MAG TPA: hypothetical protein VGU90_15355 [Terriglobales bacterium]|nr:hypothetical protein [Terriglobales bacterium]